MRWLVALALLPLSAFASQPGTAPATPGDGLPPIPAPIHGAGPGMTYALFEATVPHADLSTCPDRWAGHERFCRISVSPSEVTIWVFSEGGDQLLIDLGHVSPDDLVFLNRLPE